MYVLNALKIKDYNIKKRYFFCVLFVDYIQRFYQVNSVKFIISLNLMD